MFTSVISSLKNLGLTRYKDKFIENKIGDCEVERLLRRSRQSPYARCLDYLIPERAHQTEFMNEFERIHVMNEDPDSDTEETENPLIESFRNLSSAEEDIFSSDNSTDTVIFSDKGRSHGSTTASAKQSRSLQLFWFLCKFCFLIAFFYCLFMFYNPLLPNLTQSTTGGLLVLVSTFQNVYRSSVRGILNVDNEGKFGPSKFETVAEKISRYNLVYSYQAQLLGQDDLDTLNTLDRIGRIFINEQKHFVAESIRIFKYVYEKRMQMLGPNHTDTVETYNNLQTALEAESKLIFRKHDEDNELSKVIQNSPSQEQTDSPPKSSINVDDDNGVLQGFHKNQHFSIEDSSKFKVMNQVLQNQLKINEGIQIYKQHFERLDSSNQKSTPDSLSLTAAEMAMRKVIILQEKLIESLRMNTS